MNTAMGAGRCNIKYGWNGGRGVGPDPWFIANNPRPPAGLVLVATEGRDHGRTTRMLKHHRDNP